MIVEDSKKRDPALQTVGIVGYDAPRAPWCVHPSVKLLLESGSVNAG